MVAVTVLCLGAVAVERRRRRGEEDVARADVMLLGAFGSFVPVLGLIVAETFLRTGFPVYLALLWFIVFPVSVAYGIVKKELFDIRHLARSSVAYGAATLAITGLYALLVAAADAALVSFHWNARSPQFTLVFLFFAILAVNPLRDRMQALVDRLFDRERGRYRQTVREISEAMVSMLSIQEIVERIVRALSDAMGVERSMVLLLSDDERALVPAASGGAGIWTSGRSSSPPSTPSASTCGCGARKSRAATSPRRPTRRCAAPARNSSSASTSRCSCRCSSASTCSA